MHGLKIPDMKKAATGLGASGAATTTIRPPDYQRRAALSSGTSENLRFCAIADCIEPRNGHGGLCERHYREYLRAKYRANHCQAQAWRNAEREREIRELLCV